VNEVSPASGIRIGVSSCLLGREVRFDGGHKRDPFVAGVLSRYFELVPVCPELEIGLGVPRDPIRLQRRGAEVRVVGARDPDLDVTEPLRALGRRVAESRGDLSGYILKSKSPSCGMERVKVYDGDDGVPGRDGVGEFARVLMERRPDLPIEEEGRLNDPVLRENFIERVFTYKRWQTVAVEGLSAARIVDFHARHKLLLMAHGQSAYRALGRQVAGCGREDPKCFGRRYIGELMTALRTRASRSNHTNVLKHVQGFLKDRIEAEDKQELNQVIESYRIGQVPLVVPITLLNHHFRRHPDEYMLQQVYLNPHPPELMLRNLI
jgi:uncharacterized protein YbgA (DUF1722 family)/uncharacterized protein YbbK (DUF523 family)